MQSRSVALWVMLVSMTASSFAQSPMFKKADDLPSQLQLPEALLMLDGSRVQTQRQWTNKRRPELKRLFEHYMYGTLPPKPTKVNATTIATATDFLGGKAELKLVRISFGSTNAPEIDLMVVTPKRNAERSPVFLAMNFCGNHAVSGDPRIPLSRGWLYPSCKGCTNNHATEAARGSQAQDWDLQQIIDRGYAVATFCSADVDSDQADVSDGVYRWLGSTENSSKKNLLLKGVGAGLTHDRGTIAAWAWGFHRCVDYLVKDEAIDPKRIIAVGHSRNGKTAVLAGAFDERIAMAIPHQAGCGGTAPSRGTVGESVQQINKGFPHWFNREFKEFNTRPDRLPFDQNGLVALMAPRPVLLSNAEEDQWANPNGQFDVIRAAAPVYELLGAGKSEDVQMPPPGKLLSGKLGYYIRPGKHSMTRDDWRVFMDFADAHFKR